MEKYYVYVRPGYIEYFDNLENAQNFADEYDCEVKEISIPDGPHTYGTQGGRRALTLSRI